MFSLHKIGYFILLLESLSYCIPFDHSKLVRKIKKTDDKEFVIITASYNNMRYFKKNLDSVFKQTYRNWSLIYIDDMSTDGTGHAVQDYIEQSGFSDKVKFVSNKEKCYCLRNYYREIHTIPNDKIIVTLDGDDAFADETVLEYLNDVYTRYPEIWCTFGNFERSPQSPSRFFLEPFPNEVIKQNIFREYRWNMHHLRSFYAGLFKNIKLKDLLHDGQFIPVCEDLAYMFPIIEQCGHHQTFLKRKLYVYNVENALACCKVWDNKKMKEISNHIITSKKYKPLIKPPFINDFPIKNNTDVILFNESGPQNFTRVLNSLKKHCTSINTIFVVKPNALTGQALCYSIDQLMHTKDLAAYTSVKEACSICLQNISSDYCVLLNDKIAINQPINFNTCIEWLHKTRAFAFYGETTEISALNKSITINNEIQALTNIENSTNNSSKALMRVYKTKDLKKMSATVEYNSSMEFVRQLSALINKNNIALSFKKQNTVTK